MTSQSDLRVYNCDSWNDFIELVRPKRFPCTRIFRGHRDFCWKLSSQLERIFANYKDDHPEPSYRKLYSPDAPEKIRDIYLENFKHYAWETASLMIGEDELSPDEWWALARHHGMVTPLLDWTRSPYVAAYFAFTELLMHALDNPSKYVKDFFNGHNLPIRSQLYPHEMGTVTIWQLYFCDNLQGEGELELLAPRPPGAMRQINQQGVFTRLTHDIHLDLESYLAATDNLAYLARYNIKGSEYPQALTDLGLMGISRSTLFQDLDGAAWQANWNSEYAHYALLTASDE